MVYSRTIDSFLAYLKDLLAEVISVKPQMLRSNETERLDFILSFDDIAELRSALAERKIERLFYGGFGDIAEFYENRIGVKLFESDNDFEKVLLMTRIRNLIVHNGGRINSSFKRQYPDSEFEIGERIDLRYESISENALFLLNSVEAIDEKVTKKFGLSLIASQENQSAVSG